MTCNDQMCDPPSDQEFVFVLEGIPAADTVAALITIDTVSVVAEASRRFEIS
jgi:hypothetical protein